MVNAIPAGYPQLSPYLVVDGAAEAIDFYTHVLGATERLRLAGPDGRIGHAELTIGDAVIMLADEFPDMGARGPRSLGGSPVTLQLYVDNVDEVVGRAQASGAKLLREVTDQFYGDRNGQIEDPFGHKWSIATHVEDVDPDEMARRAAATMEGTS
jgi:PhnB protein